VVSNNSGIDFNNISEPGKYQYAAVSSVVQFRVQVTLIVKDSNFVISTNSNTSPAYIDSTHLIKDSSTNSELASDIHVLHNPISSSLNLSLTELVGQTIKFTLENMCGTVATTISESIGVGESRITIPTENIENGIYMLFVRNVDTGQELKRIKIIKM
jgi:hypothetical protein